MITLYQNNVFHEIKIMGTTVFAGCGVAVGGFFSINFTEKAHSLADRLNIY
jgi:hypothetical protein